MGKVSNEIKKYGQPEELTIGEVVMQILNERGIKQKELTELTGIPKTVINALINGKRNMTTETAILFETALGVSADFLMRIQTHIELENARQKANIAERVVEISEWSAIKEKISVKAIGDEKFSNKRISEKIGCVYNIFGVNNLSDFLSLTIKEQNSSFYKKSAKLKVNQKALFTWKYCCINESEKTDITRAFNKKGIDELARKLNVIFRENRNTEERTCSTLAEYGIKLIHKEKVDQVPVDGMSFWKGNNPTIAYTLRLKTIDNFAFTIMHELGHIKLHLEKDGEEMINVNGAETDGKEKEANDFANNAFIAPEEWNAMKERIKTWNQYTVHIAIKKEAEEIGVNPQILFGRYMHETGLYRLRRVFETDIK